MIDWISIPITIAKYKKKVKTNKRLANIWYGATWFLVIWLILGCLAYVYGMFKHLHYSISLLSLLIGVATGFIGAHYVDFLDECNKLDTQILDCLSNLNAQDDNYIMTFIEKKHDINFVSEFALNLYESKKLPEIFKVYTIEHTSDKIKAHLIQIKKKDIVEDKKPH